MRSYPVDIDPGQLVRWIMEEHQGAPARFRTVARREVEVRDIPARRELHLGDEEREDLTEVDTVATLEIAPAHAADGWALTVVVEDEADPRLPDKSPLGSGGEQIDLQTFYNEFIRSGRGIANVEVEVADDVAATRVVQLISNVEKIVMVHEGLERHCHDLSARLQTGTSRLAASRPNRP
jgi:hypothetical protein